MRLMSHLSAVKKFKFLKPPKMSKIDLYEVTKRKCEAELKLDALKGQTRLNSLKKISYELDNAMATHSNNLKQMMEITDDFKQKVEIIASKLECENYLNIDRESGVHLKNIFEEGLEIFKTKFNNCQGDELNAEGVDPFLTAANQSLQKQQELLRGIEDLLGVFNGNQENGGRKASSTQSDDTINTIVSDNVFASSPI